MADFHLNDRAWKFAREVGSIVLGVLIALGIGELADDYRWSRRAAVSNAAMNKELALAGGVLDERILAQPCLDRRLNDLALLVRQARLTRSLPSIQDVGKAPMRPIVTSAWDDVVASGTLPHLSSERRSLLSLEYPLLKVYPDDVNREFVGWSTLRIIEATPGPVSEGMLNEAALNIARLQAQGRLISLSARQTLDNLVKHGIKPDYSYILDKPGTREEVVKMVRANVRCKPLALPKA